MRRMFISLTHRMPLEHRDSDTLLLHQAVLPYPIEGASKKLHTRSQTKLGMSGQSRMPHPIVQEPGSVVQMSVEKSAASLLSLSLFLPSLFEPLRGHVLSQDREEVLHGDAVPGLVKEGGHLATGTPNERTCSARVWGVVAAPLRRPRTSPDTLGRRHPVCTPLRRRRMVKMHRW